MRGGSFVFGELEAVGRRPRRRRAGVCALAAGALFGLGTAARPAVAQSTERVSVSSSGEPGNGPSGIAGGLSLSGDGWLVAFASDASNLVPGDENGVTDIFLHDRLGGTTERVSVDAAGGDADGASRQVQLSRGGRFIAFTSDASDLVAGDSNRARDVFVRDLLTGVTERVSVGADGQGVGASDSPAISADGRFVVFRSLAPLVPGDRNGLADIYLRDRLLGITERQSATTFFDQDADGPSFRAAVSDDGNTVVLQSSARNLGPVGRPGNSYVFARRRDALGPFQLISNCCDYRGSLALGMLSGDGKVLLLGTPASRGLAPGITIYTAPAGELGPWRLPASGRLVLAGTPPDERRWLAPAAISANGRFVVVHSGRYAEEPAWDASDVNVFVGDLQRGTGARVHVTSAGESVEGYGADGSILLTGSAISDDGRVIAFGSAAPGLVPGDDQPGFDVFVRERHAAPSALVLDPAQASAQAGSEHCATARVYNSEGRAVLDVDVDFALAGVSSARGTIATDASGAAVFCHPLELVGKAAIHAQAREGLEPSARQEIEIALPHSSPGCRAAYVGAIAVPSGNALVHGEALAADGQVSGGQFFPPLPLPQDWPLVELGEAEALRCAGGAASIFGTLYVDGQAYSSYRMDLAAAAPGGALDRYRVRVAANGFDSGEVALRGGRAIVQP